MIWSCPNCSRGNDIVMTDDPLTNGFRCLVCGVTSTFREVRSYQTSETAKRNPYKPPEVYEIAVRRRRIREASS
jgi:hypothetical protein